MVVDLVLGRQIQLAIEPGLNHDTPRLPQGPAQPVLLVGRQSRCGDDHLLAAGGTKGSLDHRFCPASGKARRQRLRRRRLGVAGCAHHVRVADPVPFGSPQITDDLGKPSGTPGLGVQLSPRFMPALRRVCCSVRYLPRQARQRGNAVRRPTPRAQIVELARRQFAGQTPAQWIPDDELWHAQSGCLPHLQEGRARTLGHDNDIIGCRQQSRHDGQVIPQSAHGQAWLKDAPAGRQITQWVEPVEVGLIPFACFHGE